MRSNNNHFAKKALLPTYSLGKRSTNTIKTVTERIITRMI